MANYRTRRLIFIYFFLSIGALTMLWPFVQMILGSFMTFKESVSYPPTIIPSQFNLDNYMRVFEKMPFGTLYMNSIVTTVLRVIFNTAISALAGYTFAKFDFPGRNTIFKIVLAIMMVPGQIFLLPQYMTMKFFGWLDTLYAIWVPNIISAYGVFMMRQFFLTVPNELLEAAIIDAANHTRIFYQIALPLAKPGVLVYALQVVIASWNDLLWPLVVNTSIEKLTLPVGMAYLRGQYVVDTPALMAASVMAVIPILLLYVIFQRYFKDLGFSAAIK
ncbi:MAG: carbohydrate ABC transporter permease [Thermoanaerobacterium sp.]|nr:carbohydrate ABC transporter permease [Thermoanaerobacterium sp.]